eukprot:CAMPEP_0172934168 /NCGR_PEP_ID=MMETSP1075-20121228/220873_1 /TAXON_ID=2916 /ORGANISM="Ceratium fusus, Strain PA161109" /LENGTH=575 /DNA_ID=CAMNT_0013795517 /DNA_START=55 /DNA_END=1784 /DNA_ORIENTATION=+
MAIRVADGLSMVAVLMAVACSTSVGVPTKGATVASSCRAMEEHSYEAVLPEVRGEAKVLAQRLSTVSAMEALHQDKLKVDEHEAIRSSVDSNNSESARKANRSSVDSNNSKSARKVGFNSSFAQRLDKRHRRMKARTSSTNSKRKVAKETQAAKVTEVDKVDEGTSKFDSNNSESARKANRSSVDSNNSKSARKVGFNSSFPQQHGKKALSARKKLRVATGSRRERRKVGLISSRAEQRRKNKSPGKKKLRAATGSRHRRMKVGPKPSLAQRRGKKKASVRKKFRAAIGSRHRRIKAHTSSTNSKRKVAKETKAAKVTKVDKVTIDSNNSKSARKVGFNSSFAQRLDKRHRRMKARTSSTNSKRKVAKETKAAKVTKVDKVNEGTSRTKLSQAIQGPMPQAFAAATSNSTAKVPDNGLLTATLKAYAKQLQEKQAVHTTGEEGSDGHVQLQRKESDSHAQVQHKEQAVVANEQKAGNMTKTANVVPLLQAPKDDPMGMSKASMKVSTLPQAEQHHNHKTYSEDWQKEYPKFKQWTQTTTKDKKPTRQEEVKAGASGFGIHAVMAIIATTTVQLEC